jgi:hypothetical protein
MKTVQYNLYRQEFSRHVYEIFERMRQVHLSHVSSHLPVNW